ncbi:MAG: Wzz/FepE/Etk N-terminal domain-containing protein [Pseudomonadota bacterium]
MPESELNFRDLIGILRRQNRLILASVVLCLLFATIFAVMAKPKYRAEALVLVQPAEQNILNPIQQAPLGNTHLNARVESEVEILESPAIALDVVRRANLISDAEFGPRLSTADKIFQTIGIKRDVEKSGEELLQEVVDRFSDARSVSRRNLTFVISVAVETEDPARSAKLSNILAESYIESQVNAKVESSLAARDVLQNRLTVARAQLAQSEEALDAFIESNLAKLEGETDDAALSTLRRDLDRLEASRAQKNIINVAARSQDWGTLSKELEDEALAQLVEQRTAFEERLRGTTSEPTNAIELRAAIEDIEAELEELANSRVVDLENETRALDAQIVQTREDIRAVLFSAEVSSSTLADVYAMQQATELNRAQVQLLLARLSELESQAAVQVADSRIVSLATPPQNTSYPNLPLIFALALTAGLSLGSALALSNEFLIGSVTSKSQLENNMGARVAAELPYESLNKGQMSLADNVVDRPMTAYSEALRHTIATISQRSYTDNAFVKAATTGKKQSKCTVILVTSAVPFEGKSTTALALARTYAMSGHETLLIDADLRKPSIAGHLEKTSDFGLVDYLTKRSLPGQNSNLKIKDSMSPLKIMLGGQRSTYPTDHLFASKRLDPLIETLREEMDYIIIDTSPLLPVVDARYIIRNADVVLMVARYNSTSQRDVRATAALVKDAKRPDTDFFGILNQKDVGNAHRSYYNYYQE